MLSLDLTSNNFQQYVNLSSSDPSRRPVPSAMLDYIFFFLGTVHQEAGQASEVAINSNLSVPSLLPQVNVSRGTNSSNYLDEEQTATAGKIILGLSL